MPSHPCSTPPHTFPHFPPSQVADEHGLEVQLGMPSAGRATPAAAAAVSEADPLAQRLADLKAK